MKVEVKSEVGVGSWRTGIEGSGLKVGVGGWNWGLVVLFWDGDWVEGWVGGAFLGLFSLEDEDWARGWVGVCDPDFMFCWGRSVAIGR